MKAGQKLALLTAVTAVTMGIPVVANAQATADYTVEMGGEMPHGFSTRVMAPLINGQPTIDVATGSVIDLVGGALLIPAGENPQDWAAENTGGLDLPFSQIASDPDADLTEPFPTVAPYRAHLFGLPATDPDCGAAAESPCAFSGSGTLFGGDRSPFDGHFFVEVTALPGTTLWAVNPTNVNRQSSLRIRIVATGVSTQEFIDEARDMWVAHEQDTAKALYEKLNTTSTKHKTKSGQVVHDGYVGYDTETLVLFDMFPANIVVKKGEKVRWHFSHVSIEIHGAAFPLKAGLNAANNGFIPVCDPDGTGEGPDTFSVDFETFSCPEGSGELELDLTADITDEVGDGRYPGGAQKVENSGLRGEDIPSATGLAGGQGTWDVVFTKANAKGYKYVCTVHGRGMLGKVTVKN